MGFQVVVFLPFRACIHSTCQKNCVRSENLWATICPKTLFGVSKVMTPVRYFCYNKSSFCISQFLLRSQGCHKEEVSMATLSFLGIFPDLKQWCLSTLFCWKHH